MVLAGCGQVTGQLGQDPFRACPVLVHGTRISRAVGQGCRGPVSGNHSVSTNLQQCPS